jgi:hypothetical protein
MKPTLLGAAMVACFAIAVPMQDSRQDESAAKKIDTLTKALELEKKRTADLERRVERIELWFVAVRSASELLDASADAARRNGFEQAGPNPQARTNILEGMKGFAAELVRTAPTLAPEIVPR